MAPEDSGALTLEPLRAAPASWKRAALATCAAGAVAAGVAASLPSGEVWAGLTPGVCNEYCEASTRCGPLESRAVIQQPLNTWSNLAYLFVGLLVLRRPLRPTAVLFAASAAVLAVGSFLFHASVTREFQWLDMVGTYGVLVAVAARGYAVAFGVAEWGAVAAALLADVAFAVFKWRIDAVVALPILMLAISVPMVMIVSAGRRSARAALLPFALFVAALTLRQMDVAGIWCAPESRVFQGHALWHLLTAAALGATFACFADAQPKQPA